MSNLKTFLNVLSKSGGYPNPDIQSIAKMIGYNLDELLKDLVKEIGEDKANEFVQKAVQKMSKGDGVKMQDLDDPEQFANIHLIDPHIDLTNDETTVLSDWGWGDTNIFFKDDDGNDSYKTIEEISDEVGMGDWADFDEMVEEIREECNQLFYKNCGFGIWWDDRKDIVNNI